MRNFGLNLYFSNPAHYQNRLGSRGLIYKLNQSFWKKSGNLYFNVSQVILIRRSKTSIWEPPAWMIFKACYSSGSLWTNPIAIKNLSGQISKTNSFCPENKLLYFIFFFRFLSCCSNKTAFSYSNITNTYFLNKTTKHFPKVLMSMY